MEEAWEDPPLAKLSVNAPIGLRCLDDARNYQLTSGTHEGDAPPNAHKRTFHYEGGTAHDF
eukprot:10118486-Alexandrium_andersonii.AAC.1